MSSAAAIKESLQSHLNESSPRLSFSSSERSEHIRVDKEITIKNVWKVLKSWSFLRYTIVSLLLGVCVGLTYKINMDFFRFIITFFISSITMMIFTIFTLSQTRIISGFFIHVGVGYGFLGLLTILQRSAYPLGYLGGTKQQQQNMAVQLWICARYIEVLSFVIGIISVRKIYSGAKIRIIVFSGYLVLATFFLLSIFFDFFPDSYIGGKATTFYQATEYAFVFAFVVIAYLFTVRRRSFHIKIYCFLLVAVGLRLISCCFNAVSLDWSGGLVPVFNLTIRAVSFLFVFIGMGISTLQNPVETLFRNLIDKQAALENEKTFSEWMIEQFPSLVVLLDSTGKITHVNNYAAELLHLTRHESLGKNFFDLMVSEDQETHKENFENMIKLRMHGLEAENMTIQANFPKHGRIIEWTCKSLNFQSTTTPNSNSSSSISLKFGSKSNAESITLEMDEERKKEEKIIILCLGADITEKIQRENLLTHARNEAEKLSLLKDTFVANVSHELRTPLNCIVGVTSILLQTKLLPHQQEMVEMVTTASNSLVGVINDLLDFSSIQQGKLKMNFAPLKLRKFIEDVMVSVSVLYQASFLDFGYKISRQCPEFIYTDEKRLRQVLMNFLSNAIKFTQEGHVIVTVERSEAVLNNSDALVFKIIDSGIGIKQEDLIKLFERFTQIEHNYTRKFQGTGIGLTLSKQIVELLGGSVGLQSEFGKGTTFWFELPIQGFEDKQINGEYSPKMPGKRMSLRSPLTMTLELDEKPRKPNKILLYMKNATINDLLYHYLKDDNGLNAKKLESVEDLNKSIERFVQRKHDASKSETASLTKSNSLDYQYTVVAEISKMEEIDSENLRKINSKYADVHLIIVSPNSVQFDTADESTGFSVDIISKPVRNSQLIQHLLRKQKKKPTRAANDMSVSDELNKGEKEEDVPWRILLVEDNLTNQKVIALLLKRIGMNITHEVANNGKEAVDKFEIGKYDLIFMDCQMPVMDGYTAVENIRRIETDEGGKTRTPIIALTANAMEADREKCLRIGMDDYITKPIVLDTLKKKLEHWKNQKNGISQEPDFPITPTLSEIEEQELLQQQKRNRIEKVSSGDYHPPVLQVAESQLIKSD